jgi:hypothetical protein
MLHIFSGLLWRLPSAQLQLAALLVSHKPVTRGLLLFRAAHIAIDRLPDHLFISLNLPLLSCALRHNTFIGGDEREMSERCAKKMALSQAGSMM